jgi:PhzF family phenazine biosynthesis protein
MSRHPYLHLDVFTRRPLAGNQLAVFLHADDLRPEVMQRIALEMAFPETTFLLAPKRADTDVKMRIFTPRRELPLAGHPTIGSTFALASEGSIGPDRDEVVFELEVGPTPVSLEWAGDELSFAWMRQPRPEFGPTVEAPVEIAATLGLDPTMLHGRLPVQVVSCGLPVLLVPLVTRAAVDAIQFELGPIRGVFTQYGLDLLPVFAFSLERGHDDATAYSRMFAPAFGIPEDPATGGASGPLGSANSETKCNTPASHQGGDLGYSTIPPTTKQGESLMSYHQVTSDERYMISKLRQQDFNQAEIAHMLGRHRSTVSRELRRNSSRGDGHYRPSKAVERTRGRQSRSRRNSRFTGDDWCQVYGLLEERWSPDQIAGRLRRAGTLSISHETIYVHIWRDKAAGGPLHRYLRGAAKNCRKRRNRYDSRGRLAGKRHISERPHAVNTRATLGHWEIDTVIGAHTKDCVATLVERKSGVTMIGKLTDRGKRGLTRRVRMLARRVPDYFDTVTADNGTEFHDYKVIEAATGVRFYFATPYHSWERGTNENLNGLLRQYLPKGSSFAGLTQRDCDAIAHHLNTRPRKRLGYRTPEECFHGR